MGEKNSSDDNMVRVWLVERTYSDDEQNLIILTYATEDGENYYRKERALTSIDDKRETVASIIVDQSDLGTVEDESEINRYKVLVEDIIDKYDVDDTI